MTSKTEKIGPYHIHEEIGRGGMGILYRCQHDTTGEFTAVKVVRLPHEKLLRGIRREISTLARLKHPGIIEIIDQGEKNGLPWYAMKFIEGTTLQQYFQKLRRQLDRDPVPTPHFSKSRPKISKEYFIEVLTITRRLCFPLAFLHGEGIVHRDLKPSNVLITPAGRPVLIDFGLTSQFSSEISRETLTVDYDPVGTVGYMAPEQILHQLVDARADLYSLGCILFELLTNRQPYSESSQYSIIKAQLEKESCHVSDFIDGIPYELNQLIDKLLQKDPRNRIGFAETVAFWLDRMGARNGFSQNGPRPKPYLYKSRMVGRKKYIQRLNKHLVSLRKGTGGIHFIGGESGIGKTRFVMEFACEALKKNIQVMTGDCINEMKKPLGLFRKPLFTIVDRCRERGLAETENILGKKGKVLALYEPTLRDLPGQELYPDPDELQAATARLRLFNYLLQTFAALGQEKPLLIILDDIHWADELSMSFLKYLNRSNFDNIPFFVLATFRSEEIDIDLQECIDQQPQSVFWLDRLNDENIAVLIQDLLAVTDIPKILLKFLSLHSEGNPFYIAEYIRLAVDQGILQHDNIGVWSLVDEHISNTDEHDNLILPTPSSLQDLVINHLNLLSKKARFVVEVASIIGREISYYLLLEVTGHSEEKLFEVINDLVLRQIFERAEMDDLLFSHAKIQEIAYSQINDEQRAIFHKVTASAIELLFADTIFDHYGELGFHWECAGNTTKAREYYLQSARKAKAKYAFVEAEFQYRKYFSLLNEENSESILVRNEFAQYVLLILGKQVEAIVEHKRAIELATELNDMNALAINMLSLAVVYCRTGQTDKPLDYFNNALELAEKLSNVELKGKILHNYASFNRDQGKIEKALELYNQAMVIARDIGSISMESTILGNLALTYSEIGENETALSLYDQALQLAERENDKIRKGIVLGNLAVLNHNLGHLNLAYQQYHDALDIAITIGDMRSKGVILGNLAGLLSDLNREDEAQPMFREALRIAEQINDRIRVGIITSNFAVLEYSCGRVTQAKELLHQALSINRENGNLRFVAFTLDKLANIYRRTNSCPEQISKLLGEAIDLFSKIGDKYGLILTKCDQGHYALANSESADVFVKEVEELATEIGLQNDCVLSDLIQNLKDAQVLFDSGKQNRLFRGELFSTLPDKLKEWLNNHNHVQSSQYH